MVAEDRVAHGLDGPFPGEPSADTDHVRSQCVYRDDDVKAAEAETDPGVRVAIQRALAHDNPAKR